MAQISIIKKSDISEARRFDAEYFKPEYLEIKGSLNRIKTTQFIKVTKYIKKGIFDISPTKYRKKGVPFLRVSNMKDPFIDENDLVFLSEETNLENRKTELNYGDIILSKVGSLGDAVINLKYDKVNFSQNNIGIKIDKSKINPLYAVSFFNSKYGKKQIEKQQSGQVQIKLVLDDIKYLKIPLFNDNFQLQIEKTVKSAHQKQTQSKQLYKEAEQLLLEELGLVDYKPKHQLTFETSKKEIENATRYDAEYFQPKYAEIIKRIENYEGGFDVVGNIVNWKKGIEVGTDAYTETGKEFVRVSDFSVFGIEKSSRKISNELFEKIKKEYQPKKGEILFTKDGTIGLTYVLKKDIEGVLSSAFLSLRLKEKYQDFEKECLALILNSIISKMQVEQLSGGAIIAHLKPSDFEKFKIPLIKPQIQTQIAEKIKESHKLRKESKELLEEAKQKVEEEIEKG